MSGKVITVIKRVGTTYHRCFVGLKGLQLRGRTLSDNNTDNTPTLS